MDITTERGITPLMTAVIYENRYFTRALLQNGANANLRDINKNTALHYAVKRSSISEYDK